MKHFLGTALLASIAGLAAFADDAQIKIRIGDVEGNLTDKEIVVPASESEEKARPAPEQEPVHKSGKALGQILDSLEQEAPWLERRIADEDEKMLDAALKSLDKNISFKKTAFSEAEQTPSGKYRPPLFIGGQRELYVRLDSLDSANLANLEEDFQALSRLGKKPIGAIIDLRNCSGGSAGEAQRLFSYFSEGKTSPADSNAPEKKQDLILKNLPMIVLTGEKSLGASEIFAALVKKSGKGLIIGDETAGNPFPSRTVEISGLGFLRFPQVAEGLEEIGTSSVSPSIRISKSEQIPFEKLADEISSEKSDPALRAASEMLACFNELQSAKIRNSAKD